MSFARASPRIEKLHPESGIGGYSAYDGTVEFYARVKLLARKEAVAIDLGAGRGAWFEDETSEFRRDVRLLRGHVKHVIGLDVDPIVLHNKAVDSAKVLQPGRPWPIADSSCDLIVSDYVLEHISDVRDFGGEVRRVLRTGGWFCARTPTKYNYVSVAARLVGNMKHTRVLSWAQPGRRAEDVFPTYYRMNTQAAVADALGREAFEDFTYLYSSEPQYHFGRPWIYRTFQIAHRLLPSTLTGNLYVFLRKR